MIRKRSLRRNSVEVDVGAVGRRLGVLGCGELFDANSLVEVVEGREESNVQNFRSADRGGESEDGGTLTDGEGITRVIVVKA